MITNPANNNAPLPKEELWSVQLEECQRLLARATVISETYPNNLFAMEAYRGRQLHFILQEFIRRDREKDVVIVSLTHQNHSLTQLLGAKMMGLCEESHAPEEIVQTEPIAAVAAAQP